MTKTIYLRYKYNGFSDICLSYVVFIFQFANNSIEYLLYILKNILDCGVKAFFLRLLKRWLRNWPAIFALKQK